jgi:hypothetical protein
MNTYNHLYYLGFTLNSTEPDPDKISTDVLKEAVTKRINSGGLLEIESGESIIITEKISQETPNEGTD